MVGLAQRGGVVAQVGDEVHVRLGASGEVKTMSTGSDSDQYLEVLADNSKTLHGSLPVMFVN